MILLLIQIEELNMGKQAIEEHFLQANCKADYILIHEIKRPNAMLVNNILVYLQKLGIKVYY